MNIIFLDIDGVLNNRYSGFGHPSPLKEESRFSEYAVYQLQQIVKECNASIVISSTWRKFGTVKDMQLTFEPYGLGDYIIGMTPDMSKTFSCKRYKEIKHYMENCNHKITNFVILDDDSDMNGLFRNFIKTDAEYGLTRVDAQRAIKILKRKTK